MKKQYKEPLIQAFTQFLEDNNYILHRNFAGKTMFQTKVNDTQAVRPDQINDLLFVDTIVQIDTKDRLYYFMKVVLEKPELREAGLSFMVSKTPGENNPEYQTITKKYLDILEPYSEQLFTYVSRAAFLKANLPGMDSIFSQYIVEQDKREAIIEMYCTLPLFQDKGNQRIIYNLIDDNLNDKQKYFALLDKFSANEDIKLIKSQRSYDAYCITVNPNDLISFNPKINLAQASRILVLFPDLEPHFPKIGVEKITTQLLNDVTKEREITYFGENLNKPFLEEFSTIYLKERALGNFNELEEDSPEYELLLNETVSRAYYTVFQREIPTSSQKAKKNKI